MKLTNLLTGLPILRLSGDAETEITSVVHDSRKAVPGSLFIALRGTRFDGQNFINDALTRGATAVMMEAAAWEAMPEKPPVSVILVEDTQKMLPAIGKRFYNDPSSRLRLIGVVGTNGKTTSTFLIRSILEEAGFKTGIIGTIHNIVGERILSTRNTTPGPLELQEIFSEMVKEGVKYVVMEVSSHAIALGRVEGLTFAGGVFTNITQDHLDFHHTFEEYFRVKSSFFRNLSADAQAVINIDDPHGAEVVKLTPAHTLTFGLSPQAQIRAEEVKKSMTGTEYILVTPKGKIEIQMNLIGDFNVHNSLGALGMGLGLGIDLNTLKRGISKVTGVPGRFQTIPGGKDFTVVVDYAHSPDGLENLLKTARSLTKNRVITVFGCGGDRDKGKRPIMGRIAARLSDITIITNDNPRSEDPLLIAEEIKRGYLEGGNPANYQIILDRKEAIKEAIALAKPGDMVIIAGKGHENYQIFADRTVHFDDRETAIAALEERMHG